MKELLGALVAINCFYNNKPTRDEHYCYSTTCMMNQDPKIAKRIAIEGCGMFKNVVRDESGIHFKENP